MTTTPVPEPERWTDRPLGRPSAEDLLGGAFRAARAATSPSAAVLARVDAGLAPHVPLDVGNRRWRLAAVALLGVLAIGGTVGAARGPLRVWAARHGLIAPASPPLDQRPHQVARSTAGRKEAPIVVARVAGPASADAIVPLAPTPSSMLGTRVAVERASRPAGAIAAAAEPPVAEEARILKRVFQSLRAEPDGGGAALAALDGYDRRFPSGLMQNEARLARAEALLALGRRSNALALLDGWQASGAGLTRGARLARAELRDDAGRCPEAAEDFAAVLATSADDELGGRALYGRASCALKMGDAATAIAALTRYLDGHADGSHAAAARDALAHLSVRTPPP